MAISHRSGHHRRGRPDAAHRRRTGPSARSLGALVALALAVLGTVLSSVPAGAVGASPLSVGLNADGQLATGTTTSRTTPGATTGLTDTVAIASGREHAYALTDQGRIRAWGDNTQGAVGNNSTVDQPTPVLLGLTNVIQVEAGHYHGVALRSDGTVWTWGYNALGQLGLGDTANRRTPTQIPGLSGITQVAAGRDMSYAVRSNGTVVGWGSNAEGEVGDGTTTRRLAPVAVQGLTSVVELAGGRNHGLALRSDGSVWAWGANDYGQLGIGSTTRSLVPVRVITSGARHVDSGAEHSVVVSTDGTVRTWGRSQRGQTGLGTTATRTSPAVVPGLPAIVEVGDGRDQTFALTSTGAVWAWGHNDSGQLGDGTTTNRLSPVRISSLNGIVAAQGGRAMTVFLPGVSDPDLVPPSAPGTPTATSTVSGQATVVWPAATDDRATTLTYSVFRDAGSTPIGTVSGGTTGTVSFTDTGLTPGSVHTWRVQASDGPNTGPTSASSAPVTIAGGGGPTVLAQTSFANGLTGWTGVSNLTVDSATGSPSDAPPSARVQVTNAIGTGRLALSTPSTAACTEVDVRITSVGTGVNYAPLKLRNGAGSSIGRIWVSSAGQLSVRADVTGAQFTTAATVAPGTWNRLGLCVTVGTQGSLRLVLNGTTVGTWSANTGTSPYTRGADRGQRPPHGNGPLGPAHGGRLPLISHARSPRNHPARYFGASRANGHAITYVPYGKHCPQWAWEEAHG